MIQNLSEKVSFYDISARFLITYNNYRNMKHCVELEDEEIQELNKSKDLLVPQESKSKKILIIIIGLFMILLILSWGFMRYPLDNIIEGQLRSKSIEQDKIILKELTIIFLNNTEHLLSEIYTSEQEINLVETSTCLLGFKQENNYYVESIYYPEIHDQSFRHVSFSSCPTDTLIMLHTHPFKHCLASETDTETLKKAQKTNENLLMIIMCEPNRYSIYT